MATREEQREKRRLDILEAALDLFTSKGYGATRTSDIAKAVKMSDGLLFHYFASKEMLYLEIVKMATDWIKQEETNADQDAITYFYNICHSFFEMSKENRNAAKMFVLMEEAQNKHVAPAKVYELASQVSVITSSVPIIEKGQKEGLIRKGDALSLSYAFWTAFQGIMQELAKNPEMPVPQTDWIISIIKQEDNKE